MTEPVKLSPRQWVKAVGVHTFSVVWCAGWLLWDLFHFTGWERVALVAVFTALLALALDQWPRSLRSYRSLVASERRLGASRGRFLSTAVMRGWPVDVVFQVDRLLMRGELDSARALLEEHRPPRRRPMRPMPPIHE